MLRKLKIKFVIINMTLVTCMLVFILCMIIQFTKQNVEQTSIQMMEQLASNPLYLIKPTDDFLVRLPYFSLRLTPGGELIESLTSAYDLSDRSFLDTLIHVSHRMPTRTGVLSDYNLRYMRISTPTDQFMIYVDITNEITTVNNLIQTCVFIGIISFFVFLAISIFLANWAVKPVDQAWKQQKQFLADASHELKTPLTVILTNAELLKNPTFHSVEKDLFIEHILIMASQMKTLVEGLLDLSKADNGSMKLDMKKTNLRSLLETAICLFEPIYYENQLELTTNIFPEVTLMGCKTALGQVLEILLDNALKYSLPGTTVHIQLKKQPFSCLLSVTSHGDTLTPDDLKNIFKRFYRTDESRSRSGSYGLGLAIAKSIVKEHHGKIWAQSQHGENTFFVWLPMIS